MGVSAWQDELELKTYLLGPDDPNPPWQRTGMSRIYPYPMQDDLTGEAKTLRYKALHLENEYLHLIVLPGLGGRVYSLYDKLARREVFYRNNVVKYGLVARRGAWISGGIEFNFPQGHTCVTVSPVPSAITQNPQTGGASISVGTIDRVSRMRWSVRLSLLPGEARLRQDVMLHNPMPYRQRHYFWANSAVPAADDLRLVYPATRVRTLGGIHSYPICDGLDLSLYRNHDRANDIFCLNSKEDFFGCYYEQKDVGLVHWSDHRVNFGKKFFTWGTADDGMIWADLLTDDDGQYVELQSGRFVDQSTFEFLFPFQTVKWTEYWWPLHGMGGVVYANDTAAINLQIGGGKAKIGLMANRRLGRGELVLQRRGGEVWSESVDVRPENPVAAEIPYGAFRTRQADASLSLFIGKDQVIFHAHPVRYSVEEQEEIFLPRPPLLEGADATAEQLCVEAVRQEKLEDFDKARALHEKALAKAPGFSAAHVGLGILDFRAGLPDKSLEHLQKAVACDPENDEAAYYLALAHEAVGNSEAAQALLWRLLGRSACRTEAAILLATIRSRTHHRDEARRLLSEAPDNPTTAFLRALSWRWDDRLVRVKVEEADEADPLCPEMRAEEYFLALKNKDAAAARQALERLVQVLNDDPELWIELFLAYREIGMIGNAYELLEFALREIGAVRRSPMPHFLRAHGLSDDPAQSEYKSAIEADPEHCFPSRVEEISVLDFAVTHGHGDWRVWLYLGNLLASLGRRDEAMDAWTLAASARDASAVPCRNIALAHGLWRKDHKTALAWYQRAIERRPDDYRLYLERDTAMQTAGAKAEERLTALDSAPPSVRERWQVAARRVECLVQLERWDEAIALMRAHQFRPWEGARQMHVLWTKSLVGRADKHKEAADLQAALADHELALTYPRNLGVGRSAYAEEARIHWLLAETAHQLGDAAKHKLHLLAAAGEKHRSVCEADLYTLRALQSLKKKSEANKLAATLRQWAEERRKAQPKDALAQRIIKEVNR